MPGAPTAADFFSRTRDAKKVMVLDLGFLGDAVHLLPALWMVRRAYPQAELHVALATHATPLLELVPWVNRAWGYMRFPRHATLRENFQMVAALRREKFDVLINLNGSDRSSWLTFLSGARERLGRMPGEKTRPFWRQKFTACVFYPFYIESLSLQRCRCLEMAGFPFIAPEFHVEISSAHLRAAEIAEADTGNYFHISPFTTADRKELPPAQLAEFIVALQKMFPEKKLVLSCAPTEREQGKMSALLAALPQKPWRVFPGNLTIPQLAAVIRHSAVNFSGDTGTMHLAAMAGTPLVAWFWPNPGRAQWLPAGGNFRVLVGENSPDSPHLLKIPTDDLLRAAQSVLAAARENPYPAAQKSGP
jgi:ADP-heptose:LPS heptosyltransferase